VGRAELEALLTGMLEGEATPGNLAQRLRALGVRVGTGEITDESPGSLVPTNETPGLDTMLPHMNADQLKAVARRFHPGANAGRVAESKKAVMQALGKPALLDDMLSKLNPLERALLSEVKRRGGVADGWALTVYAALHEFRPVERAGAGSVYKSYLGSAPAMGYLGILLRDGLLIPAGRGAAQLSTVHVYGSEPDIDVLSTDLRVLARLPDELPTAPPPLELEPPPSVTPTAGHPLGTLLELFDVLHLVSEEGGLQVTQRGTVGKPMLSRLLKRRPRLEGRLERLLTVALALGLLTAPESGSSKDPWRVDQPRLHSFQAAPLAVSYSLLVEAYLNVPEPDDESWGPRYTGLISDAVAADALLQSLVLLPEEPVAMEAALAVLWERALKHVSSSRRWQGEDDQDRPAWFTGVLLGAFRDLGLVAVAELPDAQPPEPTTDRPGGVHVMRGDKLYRYRGPSEGDDAYRYALMPALGLRWWTEGQRWRSAPPNLEPDLELNLEPDTGKPAEPSLLIQPNFDILVYLDKLSPPAITALSCAYCTRVDAQTASYTLGRSSLYRALESGLELDTLLGLLQAHSMGVPENVARSLEDWASRRERLRVREGVTLLEYADQKERDAALNAEDEAQAVAKRFLLVATTPGADATSVKHLYGSAPGRTLRFSPDGHFRVEGATDLAGRAVLAQLATPNSDGTYRINVASVRAGALTTAARDALTTRARGGLPPPLEALLNIWAGGDAPAVAKVSIFQHASAAALAQHPAVAPHLGGPLSNTDYLIVVGQEKALEQTLTDLGVTFSRDLTAGVRAQAVGGSVMQSGLDTRKMRALIETTISEVRSLELRYHREKETYDGYGYGKKSRGKLVTEKITPSAVVYSGSTPYMTGETLAKGEPRYLRIGYITGIMVL